MDFEFGFIWETTFGYSFDSRILEAFDRWTSDLDLFGKQLLVTLLTQVMYSFGVSDRNLAYKFGLHTACI
jgi:hypothetical protein